MNKFNELFYAGKLKFGIMLEKKDVKKHADLSILNLMLSHPAFIRIS